MIEDLRPDGSYVFKDEGRTVVEQGQWIQKSPADLCFTANTGGATEICHVEAVREDGIQYSTRTATKDTTIIERIKG